MNLSLFLKTIHVFCRAKLTPLGQSGGSIGLEIGTMATLMPVFHRRGVKAIGLSVDGVGSNLAWLADIEDTQGVKIELPADC